MRCVMSPHERDHTENDEHSDRTRQHDRCEQDDPEGHEPGKNDEHAHGATPFPECF